MAGSRTGCGDRCLEGWIDGRTSLRMDGWIKDWVRG